MLVLTRMVDEQILIGKDIVIIVLELRRGKVKLGFDADKSIPIHRREVYDKIQREKEKP